MTRKELTDTIASLVAEYLAYPSDWGTDPQIRIVPSTLLVDIVRRPDSMDDIADNDYAIEAAAAVDGDYSESAADFQAASNPDLYPVGTLIDYTTKRPRMDRIAEIAAQYIPETVENGYSE